MNWDLIERILRLAGNAVLVVALALAVLVPPLVMVLAYFSLSVGLPFDLPERIDLPLDAPSWGVFGDYIGGVVGTWFSVLAFAGVLLTVRLQSKQLEDASKRAQVEELQRLAASISKNIDEMLKASVPSSMLWGGVLPDAESTPSYFQALNAAAQEVARYEPEREQELRASSDVSSVIDSARGHMGLVVVELRQLVWCLTEFEKAGGSGLIAQFYDMRFGRVVDCMDILGLNISRVRSGHFFTPIDLRALWFKKPSPKRP